MPHLFYISHIRKNTAFFDDIETHHMKVVHTEEESIIYATDGKGNVYRVKIEKFEKKSAVGKIVEVKSLPKPYATKLTVIVALFKWKRMRFILEKALELGVDELRIFKGEHSQLPFKSEYAEKFRRVIVEAAKQAFNPWFPELHLYSNLIKALEELDGRIFVAHKKGKPARLLLDEYNGEKTPLTLIIGPEGDFSKREFEVLESLGVFMNLGPYILRSETAFIVGVGIMNLMRHTGCA